jgi:hypothetical protein
VNSVGEYGKKKELKKKGRGVLGGGYGICPVEDDPRSNKN